ncbi:hypothetical protein GCM10027296_37770 [Chitinimonas naiadis]
MTIRLTRIVAPNQTQLSELYQVCSQAPGYWRLTEGKSLPSRDAIAAWFTGSELPAGRNVADQQIYGVFHGEELVGVTMLLKGWRYPGQSMIGLLLLSERWQGQGLGRQAYERIEQLIRGWPGMRTVRIGIIASNEPAFPFWRKLGFVETGERKRDLSFLADTILLEKSLVVSGSLANPVLV